MGSTRSDMLIRAIRKAEERRRSARRLPRSVWAVIYRGEVLSSWPTKDLAIAAARASGKLFGVRVKRVKTRDLLKAA